MKTIHGVIYGLHDPETGELRYIGQTITSVPGRVSRHCTPGALKRHSYLARWLLGLVKRGLAPTWSLVAEAQDQAELDRLEVEHIARARAEGVRLVNLSAGGGGRAGYVTPPEVRAKLRASNLGKPHPKHTQEWKATMAARMVGRTIHTEASKAAIAAAKKGVPRSPEVIAKVSAALKGRVSPMKGRNHSAEAKARCSENRKGKCAGALHHRFREDVSVEAVLRLLGQGQSKVEVAEALHTSRAVVYQRIAEAKAQGLLVPKPPKRAWNKGKKHSSEHLSNWRASRWAGKAA